MELFLLGPQTASQSVAEEHKLFYFVQAVSMPGAAEAAEPGSWGEAAAWLCLPAERLSQAAGSPAHTTASAGSGQPQGDARATTGVRGPTTRHSNFSTNSLASIWGRRLLCRRRQPAASGRAPTTATANPW